MLMHLKAPAQYKEKSSSSVGVKSGAQNLSATRQHLSSLQIGKLAVCHLLLGLPSEFLPRTMSSTTTTFVWHFHESAPFLHFVWGRLDNSS